MMGAMTRMGSTSNAAAHQLRRSSGNAHQVAATSARKPTTIQMVTAHSPSTSHRRAAASQGTNAYGNAYACP